MYRPAKLVERCQCCQQGVALPDAQGSSDFFWDDDSAQIVHSSDNASCFHISFSFYDPFDGRMISAPTWKMLVRACRGDPWSPATIILQITMLLFASWGDLYRPYLLCCGGVLELHCISKRRTNMGRTTFIFNCRSQAYAEPIIQKILAAEGYALILENDERVW